MTNSRAVNYNSWMSTCFPSTSRYEAISMDMNSGHILFRYNVYLDKMEVHSNASKVYLWKLWRQLLTKILPPSLNMTSKEGTFPIHLSFISTQSPNFYLLFNIYLLLRGPFQTNNLWCSTSSFPPRKLWLKQTKHVCMGLL